MVLGDTNHGEGDMIMANKKEKSSVLIRASVANKNHDTCK